MQEPVERHPHDYQLQELARILDATLGSVHPEGLSTGQNALRILDFLAHFPGMAEYVSPQFHQHLCQELTSAQQRGSDSNVRAEIKRMLMYPRQGYPPWQEIQLPPLMSEVLDGDTANVFFRFELVEGKVYAVCVSERSLVDVLWHHTGAHLQQVLQNPGLVANVETCHITLVNSDVVAQLGEERVRQFLAGLVNRPFPIKVGTRVLKTTVSEDWSRFSQCVVASVYSPHVNGFLVDFNQHFQQRLSPSPHVTFAIVPRSLF